MISVRSVNIKMHKSISFLIFFIIYYINSDVTCQGINPLTPKCMGCICEAITNCDTSGACSGDICGPFGITWGYWADGGKPTVNNQNPEEASAYGRCASDPTCSSYAVQGYMKKYGQDCNGDGKIDCDDFAAIHKLGGYGCRSGLPDFYVNRYEQCKKIVGHLN